MSYGRSTAITIATAIVALAITSNAEAKTLHLNWVERTSGSDYPAMTFVVKRFTINGARWSIRASISNRSRDSIIVKRGYEMLHQYRFGVLVPETKNCGPDYGTPCGVRLMGAQSTTPAFPHVFRSGRTWSGTIAGSGELPRAVLLELVFGYFVDPKLNTEGFAWITQHSFKL